MQGVFAAKDEEALYSQQKQDQELWLISRIFTAKFILKLKKVGKTTRAFSCDINQITYDYAVEVINRFNRLDLIDRLPEELRMEDHDIVWEAVLKTTLKKNKCKKAKWLSEEA